MALREGIARTIYLGGLGEPHSRHLRSRHETARLLAELRTAVYLTPRRHGRRAGSESYRTLRYLVERLPAMIAPAWLKVPTQPIAIDDVLAYLTAARDLPESAGREIQIAARTSCPTARCSTAWSRLSGGVRGPTSRAAADTAAIVTLDRPGNPGRCRRRPSPDRGALYQDRRHRHVRREALRHNAAGIRGRARACGRRRIERHGLPAKRRDGA